MTNIDEIRKLLDERGIDYDEYTRFNSQVFMFDYCDTCGDYLSEIEIFGACICAMKKYLNPEQAISTALESGTCRNEWAEFGKFRCSECWTQVDAISTNTTQPIPIRYCPNCGAKVINQ